MKSGTARIVIAVLVVFDLWILNWALLKDYDGSGEFGDMFGAVNALFSGLAFAGLIYAILLQRKELELQREELALTRVELRGQKEQLKAQNATMSKQSFESTFFELLKSQNQLVNSIDLYNRKTKKTTTGRDCFTTFYSRLATCWAEYPNLLKLSEEEKLDQIYMIFFRSNEAEIGHYFRSLYNIIKFVERNGPQDKKFYTNLVRAQLSSFELALLFYNALSSQGSQKFKPLIERYALLKTVPRNLLIDSAAHLPLYDHAAYAGSDS